MRRSYSHSIRALLRFSSLGFVVVSMVAVAIFFWGIDFKFEKKVLWENSVRSSEAIPTPFVIGGADSKAMRGASGAWSKSPDDSQAEAGADKLGDQQIIDQALARAATDPFDAMEWVVVSVRSDELMDRAMLSIVDIWADRRPSQAAEFIEQLPEGHLREQAADHLAGHWSRISPTVAYIWMKGSVESDRLLANLAGQP